MELGITILKYGGISSCFFKKCGKPDSHGPIFLFDFNLQGLRSRYLLQLGHVFSRLPLSSRWAISPAWLLFYALINPCFLVDVEIKITIIDWQPHQRGRTDAAPKTDNNLAWSTCGHSLSIISNCFTSQSNKVASIVTELVEDNGQESYCFNAHFLYAISISSLQLPARFPFSTYRSWTSQTHFRASSTCLSRIRTISCLKYTGKVINPVPIYKNLYVSHLGVFWNFSSSLQKRHDAIGNRETQFNFLFCF